MQAEILAERDTLNMFELVLKICTYMRDGSSFSAQALVLHIAFPHPPPCFARSSPAAVVAMKTNESIQSKVMVPKGSDARSNFTRVVGGVDILVQAITFLASTDRLEQSLEVCTCRRSHPPVAQ